MEATEAGAAENSDDSEERAHHPRHCAQDHREGGEVRSRRGEGGMEGRLGGER